MKEDFERMEQYDLFINRGYFELAEKRYSKLIGVFLIRFSELENSLNIAISEMINSRGNELGYIIIERLTLNNKIELWYKLTSFLINHVPEYKGHKKQLKNLKDKIESLNNFRNIIVHANWLSINKKNFVRSKIITDNEEGYIKFKKVKVNSEIIKSKIKEVGILIKRLEAME